MFTSSKRKTTRTAVAIGLALTSASSVAALTATPAAFATTTTEANLANQIAILGTKAHDGGTLATLATPALNLMSLTNFDWNKVMFGTDTLSTSQQQTSTDLTPDVRQLATFSVKDVTSATVIINDVITKMQTLNPSIQSTDVLNFLETIEQNSATELLSLLGLQSVGTLTQATAATSMETLFSTNLGSASSAIQAIFSAAGPKAVGGSGGSAGRRIDRWHLRPRHHPSANRGGVVPCNSWYPPTSLVNLNKFR